MHRGALSPPCLPDFSPQAESVFSSNTSLGASRGNWQVYYYGNDREKLPPPHSLEGSGMRLAYTGAGIPGPPPPSP